MAFTSLVNNGDISTQSKARRHKAGSPQGKLEFHRVVYIQNPMDHLFWAHLFTTEWTRTIQTEKECYSPTGNM